MYICTILFKNSTLNALEARFSIVLYAKILNGFMKQNTIQENTPILIYMYISFIKMKQQISSWVKENSTSLSD